VRLRLFLGMWAAIALVVGLTVVAADVVDLGGADDQVVDGGAGPDGTPAVTGATTTSTTASAVVPGPGQVAVHGTVTAVHLEGAVLTPRELPAPITVVSDRGFGNGGELTGVLVDGRPATVVWDGGRPFVLSSGAALVVEPGPVDLVPEGLRLLLGGGAHRLRPGSYRLDTPVAVGSTGIATPRDGVTFDATDGSLFEARGDAGVVLGPDAARRFTGPGAVHLEGALELTDAAGTRAATTLDAAAVAFELTFTPDGAGGWAVAGLVDDAAA
jgi:hypothetical protein